MGKEKLFSEIFNKYDQEVIEIDRVEENEAIMRFQETQDMSILEEVYIKRIPTLKNWALKFYYPGLENSIDDFMEELSIVFVKAAHKYNIEKGAFNTCLYTYLNNRIKNMKNSTHAKKRRPENYDGPISGILLSLDYTYSNDKGEGETTLRDLLVRKESGEEGTNETNFQETVNFLSDGNDLLKNVFIKLGEGNTLSAILRDIKTLKGCVEVSKQDLKNLKKNEDSLKSLIVEKEGLGEREFKVVDLVIKDKNVISYSIELKDSAEATLIQKTIKDLRKNKEQLLKKIKEE